VFAVIGTPCLTLWAGFGAGLRQILTDPVKLLRVNRTMAVLAAITAGLFWL
jgi:hypothetical protein